jgi:two-component SAPR family response regulator
MASLNTVEERDAYSILHRMIFRIKKIIEKVPVENKRLVSFAAALSLIKEHYQNNKEPLDLEMQYLNRLNTNLNEELEFIEQYEKKIFTFKQFVEEAPANNAAATPGIDGFTPETLGVPKGKQPKLLRRKKIYA